MYALYARERGVVQKALHSNSDEMKKNYFFGAASSVRWLV